MNQFEPRPTMFERSVMFEADRLEYSAINIIKAARDRPEEAAKAVEIARRVREMLKEL